MHKLGVLHFTFSHKPGEILERHIYRGEEVIGEPIETEEMRPEWFALAQIPYEQMWPGDKFWLPLLIEGKQFHASIHFDEKYNLLETEIAEIKV